MLEEVRKIASAAAPHVENTRPLVEGSFQQLVEQVDVDRAELFLQLGGRGNSRHLVHS